MKKLVLAFVLLIGMNIPLFADSTELIQFRQYVEATKNFPKNPAGMTVSSDEKYRIIYVAMPIAISSSDATAEVQKEMKKNMVLEMRKEKADCSVIKNLKITLVYAFIATDKKIFSICISYKDL